MTNYVRSQKKVTIYYDGHDYYDVPALALKAVDYLTQKGTPDALLTYGEDIHLYVKKNKAGITVRQLHD